MTAGQRTYRYLRAGRRTPSASASPTRAGVRPDAYLPQRARAPARPVRRPRVQAARAARTMLALRLNLSNRADGAESRSCTLTLTPTPTLTLYPEPPPHPDPNPKQVAQLYAGLTAASSRARTSPRTCPLGSSRPSPRSSPPPRRFRRGALRGLAARLTGWRFFHEASTTPHPAAGGVSPTAKTLAGMVTTSLQCADARDTDAGQGDICFFQTAQTATGTPRQRRTKSYTDLGLV